MTWTGAVVHPLDARRSVRFGSCIAIGDGQWFLTCAHVVAFAAEQGFDLSVGCAPHLDDPVPVEDVLSHPTADLSILHAPHDSDLPALRSVAPARPGFPVSVRWRGLTDWHNLKAVAIKTPPITGRHSYECFAFGPPAEPGVSGAAVTSAYGDVWGLVTSNVTFADGGLSVGVALALEPVWEWIEEVSACQQTVATRSSTA